jgi:hypothetical protein
MKGVAMESRRRTSLVISSVPSLHRRRRSGAAFPALLLLLLAAVLRTTTAKVRGFPTDVQIRHRRLARDKLPDGATEMPTTKPTMAPLVAPTVSPEDASTIVITSFPTRAPTEQPGTRDESTLAPTDVILSQIRPLQPFAVKVVNNTALDEAVLTKSLEDYLEANIPNAQSVNLVLTIPSRRRTRNLQTADAIELQYTGLVALEADNNGAGALYPTSAELVATQTRVLQDIDAVNEAVNADQPQDVVIADVVVEEQAAVEPPVTDEPESSNAAGIVGGILGALFVVVLIFTCWVYGRARKEHQNKQNKRSPPPPPSPPPRSSPPRSSRSSPQRAASIPVDLDEEYDHSEYSNQALCEQDIEVASNRESYYEEEQSGREFYYDDDKEEVESAQVLYKDESENGIQDKTEPVSQDVEVQKLGTAWLVTTKKTLTDDDEARSDSDASMDGYSIYDAENYASQSTQRHVSAAAITERPVKAASARRPASASRAGRTLVASARPARATRSVSKGDRASDNESVFTYADVGTDDSIYTYGQGLIRGQPNSVLSGQSPDSYNGATEAGESSLTAGSPPYQRQPVAARASSVRQRAANNYGVNSPNVASNMSSPRQVSRMTPVTVQRSDATDDMSQPSDEAQDELDRDLNGFANELERAKLRARVSASTLTSPRSRRPSPNFADNDQEQPSAMSRHARPTRSSVQESRNQVFR